MKVLPSLSLVAIAATSSESTHALPSAPEKSVGRNPALTSQTAGGSLRGLSNNNVSLKNIVPSDFDIVCDTPPPPGSDDPVFEFPQIGEDTSYLLSPEYCAAYRQFDTQNQFTFPAQLGDRAIIRPLDITSPQTPPTASSLEIPVPAAQVAFIRSSGQGTGSVSFDLYVLPANTATSPDFDLASFLNQGSLDILSTAAPWSLKVTSQFFDTFSPNEEPGSRGVTTIQFADGQVSAERLAEALAVNVLDIEANEWSDEATVLPNNLGGLINGQDLITPRAPTPSSAPVPTTAAPTERPTQAPTTQPTNAPTSRPTSAPTTAPIGTGTPAPTTGATGKPNPAPSESPATVEPTPAPSSTSAPTDSGSSTVKAGSTATYTIAGAAALAAAGLIG